MFRVSFAYSDYVPILFLGLGVRVRVRLGLGLGLGVRVRVSFYTLCAFFCKMTESVPRNPYLLKSLFFLTNNA